MKKSALLLLLLATVVVVCHAGIVVTTKVTVGRPSRGCHGTGLCRVETTTTNQTQSPVRMELLDGKAQLKVTFSPEAIQSFPEEVRTEISRGYFSQPEVLLLSSEVSMALGAKSTVSLQAGHYEAKSAGRDIVVVFDLLPGKA